VGTKMVTSTESAFTTVESATTTTVGETLTVTATATATQYGTFVKLWKRVVSDNTGLDCVPAAGENSFQGFYPVDMGVTDIAQAIVKTCLNPQCS
jgi:hypothetical protein